MLKEPFDKDLLAKMEAGNRKIYSKDMTPIALTTQHKRGIVGAYVEGRIKLPNSGANKASQQTSTNQNQASRQTTRGGTQGTRGTRGSRGSRGGKGRGGRGGSRGGGTRKASTESTEDSQPKPKHARGAQGQQTRGEPLPLRSNKKLVDKIEDPHVQAIVRNQLETGDF